ncbi:spore coat protein [Lentibacillus jeotgali]|uniref:spore coat protein n=1 Tax=Lentibacillus jeotgali TaxID=558169 RepID=UPI0002EFC77A|nr:spore coat protein [Lentibacillus jeotgali]
MNSDKRHGIMNSYGKSKYFYLRDKRKHRYHHCCQDCGSNDCSFESNKCDSCREVYKQQDQKEKCKHERHHRCQGCGSNDCSYESSQCDSCKDAYKQQDQKEECKHERHHRCQSCGSNDCSYESSQCKKCKDKHTHHKHHNQHDRFEMVEVDSDALVSQDASQYSFMDQESAEMIWVKESCNITVDSRDTQIGLSLQASLQLAISLVVNIAIADSARSEAISQDLMQSFNSDQINRQKIFIYNTKDANVTTRDTDLAVNIQVLLQLLLLLVVMIDIL